MKVLGFGLLCTMAVLPVRGMAQDAGFASSLEARPPSRAKSRIVYAAEAQTVPAGKSAALQLRFTVQDGFHVNSHTPRAEFLLPTTLTLEPTEGVKTAALEYPPGTAYSFSFSFGPDEKLDVYAGAFTVKVPVVAAAGEHRMTGRLRYQACDHAACYPPKTLPVEILFEAR